VCFLWGMDSALWREGGLSFTIAAGPRQRSHSRVRVPWDSRPYFTVSDSRLPFCRLPRLAGLRWRYLKQPPHGILQQLSSKPRLTYNPSARTTQKIPFLCCCTIRVCCCGNVFTEPLPRNICYICLSRGCCIAKALHATTFSKRCHTTAQIQNSK
jgi:hypothetical protein